MPKQIQPNPRIYTIGGAVQANDGAYIYIPRRADQQLLEYCRTKTFAYILSARQVGKSSLIFRTAEQLSFEGTRSVIINTQEFGRQVTAESWYLGLLECIKDQLDLKTDVGEWWRAKARTSLPINTKLIRFFRDVLLAEVTQPVVVFVDEVDLTLELNFTDDFYAAIRMVYDARGNTAKFKQLSFVLMGMTTPDRLISDPTRTPFKVGERVDLTDFTFTEALPLTKGLGLPETKAKQVLNWVLKMKRLPFGSIKR